MRKRERTREQAAELRQMQKLFLLKAMANPGQPVSIVLVHFGQLGFGRWQSIIIIIFGRWQSSRTWTGRV